MQSKYLHPLAVWNCRWNGKRVTNTGTVGFQSVCCHSCFQAVRQQGALSCRWRKIEAAIRAHHQVGGSSRLILISQPDSQMHSGSN